MNEFSVPGELRPSPGHSRRGLIGSVEDAQATAERVRALMQAVHLAIHDASDALSLISSASGTLAKLQTIDLLADIVDSHGAELSLALDRISGEATKRTRAEAAASV